jgi:hypothetical protein
MKPSKTYHYRIVVDTDSGSFVSDDYTIETGSVTNLIAEPMVEDTNPDAVARGFIVSSSFNKMVGGKAMAFILDADGELVWWYQSSLKQVSRARISYDGKFMMMITGNTQGNGGIEIVTLDGQTAKTFDQSSAHHDLVPAPNGKIAYLDTDFEGSNGGGPGGHGGGGTAGNEKCGRIVELDLDGTTTMIYDTAEIWTIPCHANAIRYSATEDLYTVSDLNHSQIIAIDRQGEVKWLLNQDGQNWTKQHGHHLLEDSILIFNNGQNSSLALEFTLPDAEGKINEIWRYEGGQKSMTLGDVQRLPNGNTLVTYSNNGIIHEVDQEGNLVRKITSKQAAPGYAVWRSSLYQIADDITL